MTSVIVKNTLNVIETITQTHALINTHTHTHTINNNVYVQSFIIIQYIVYIAHVMKYTCRPAG